MRRFKTVLTIFFAFFLSFSFFFLSTYNEKTYAAISCPSNIDPNSQACIDYLNNELSKLENEQSSIQKKLKAEEYQQLSLTEKISYMRKQISDTEKVIKSLEVEIAAHDVGIKLLEKSILEKEDSISLLRQEVNMLEKTVSERVTESYKYSFVGAFEIFLDVKNISSVLRKTKYLAETRNQDKKSLEEFGDKMDTLRMEEAAIAQQKTDLQVKRNSIEKNKADLAEERNNLSSQKAEQDSLLAESKRKEAEYKAELTSVSKSIAEADAAVVDLIMRLFAQGYFKDGTKVSKGQTIAHQGHTGCSFGSHLHFEIRTSSGARLDPLLKYLTLSGSYVVSNKYSSPLSSALLTWGYRPGHQAIDLVSKSSGNQKGERYTVPYGLCSVVDNILNCRRYGLKIYCGTKEDQPPRSDWNLAYLTGEGAPIKAVANGTVYYGVESTWHGKYALVVHDDGNKSFYLHIQ